MSMKKIILLGFPNHRNLGDQAIALAEEIGKQLAKVLSDKGGKEILEQIRMELNP